MTLNNSIDIYFHMRNHYKKLKHVKSVIDCFPPKGAPRKEKVSKERIDRHESREIRARSCTRTPSRRTSKDSQKEKSRSLARNCSSLEEKKQNLTPNELIKLNCEQHEYLQFSLRITEDIIKNDLYTNEQMKQVLNSHFEANEGRLDKDKMKKAIVELCKELNIPSYESLLNKENDMTPSNRIKCICPKPELKAKICDCECVNTRVPPIPCWIHEHTLKAFQNIGDTISNPQIQQIMYVQLPSNSGMSQEVAQVTFDSSKFKKVSQVTNTRTEEDLSPPIDDQSSMISKCGCLSLNCNQSTCLLSEDILKSPTSDLSSIQNVLKDILKAPPSDLSSIQHILNDILKFPSNEIPTSPEAPKEILDEDKNSHYSSEVFKSSLDELPKSNDEFKENYNSVINQSNMPITETPSEQSIISEVAETKISDKKEILVTKEAEFNCYCNNTFNESKRQSKNLQEDNLKFYLERFEKEFNHPKNIRELACSTFVTTIEPATKKDLDMQTCSEKLNFKERETQTTCELKSVTIQSDSLDDKFSDLENSLVHNKNDYIKIHGPIFVPKSSIDEKISVKVPNPRKNVATYVSHRKEVFPTKHNLLYTRDCDLTPQRDILKSKPNTASQCYCEINNNLLLNDQYLRYNDNLHHFYPTIATQVSSTDLRNYEENLLKLEGTKPSGLLNKQSLTDSYKLVTEEKKSFEEVESPERNSLLGSVPSGSADSMHLRIQNLRLDMDKYREGNIDILPSISGALTTNILSRERTVSISDDVELISKEIASNSVGNRRMSDISKSNNSVGHRGASESTKSVISSIPPKTSDVRSNYLNTHPGLSDVNKMPRRGSLAKKNEG